ncbi:MAG: Excinuclease ABC C subunit domain protein [Parcubacteria group bacterium GW2011_GWA2_43_11]|nr:MAG: Excinuclease ABC C subunit domain protein [Parcubacteria group bacterium GW2011_GWC2_42_11]KKS86239.1 MAG: Excinuclease ABC C subunit domain protein [Parcubacteria group bacterium GW2011_GWA2_43_11]
MILNHSSIQKLPDASGVYFFLGPKQEVLYVGKATSLKDRVRSYFASTLASARGNQMVAMVERAVRVDFRQTDSVLEALILEAKCIKELKPPFNVRDKDDKSFNFLIITIHEAYPRLLTVRGKELPMRYNELVARNTGIGKKVEPLVYGPFPHATQFKQALKIIRKIFPYYDTKRPVDELMAKNDSKLRFNQSIGVYPNASITKEMYRRNIRHIKTIFDGKLQSVVVTLERDMRRFAKQEQFENAHIAKKQLFALQHIEDVSLIRKERGEGVTDAIRIEGYDVAHLGGKNTVGVMVAVVGGEAQKKEYRTFTIRTAVEGSDTGALKELLERRLAHPEWQYPRIIVLDGGIAQLNTAKKVLAEAGVAIPLIAVTKDAHHNPRSLHGPIKIRTLYQGDILLANAEAHRFSLAVHTKKRAKHLLG